MEIDELENLTGKNHNGNRANLPLRILTATSIIGDNVVNHGGESLGKISEIMLNVSEGRIEYVIIAFGGFLGFRQKFFAVPFNALTVDAGRQVFIFDKSRESFETSPGFNRAHWPHANFHAQFAGFSGGFMGPNTGASY
jgi:sporulation protein YlmC with PRC-barrel domain